MERIIMHKKSKIAASNVAGSTGSKSVGDPSKKPLSDLTNLNLIPIHILQKLCSNSISTSDAPPLLWKSQVPVFPIHQNSISSNADSKCPTSIGSSNTNTITTCQLPHFSSASSGDEDEDRELIPHGKRQKAVNLEQHVKINSPSSNFNAVGKTNNKGQSVSMQFRTTRASEANNKHKAVLGPPESTPLEKVIAKATRVIKPVSFTPVQKLKDKISVSVAPFKVNQPEKTRDEGKETTVSFGSIDETKAKGKAVAMPWSSIFEQTEDKRSPILFVNSPETNKRKESVIEVEPNIVAESYSPVQKVNGKPSANAILHEAIPGRTTDKGKATLVSFGSISYDKTKDKGKAVAMPWSRLSEQREDKGDSTALVNCLESKKRKESIIEVESNAVSESYTPVQKVNDKTRASSILHEASPEKAKDKGKAAFVSFGSSSFYDKEKDKGKAVALPWNGLCEQTEDKRNPALVLHGRPQTNKRKKSIGLVVSASSCPALQRKRNTWYHELIPHGERQKAVNLERHVKINFPSSSFNAVGKTNNKGQSVSMPFRTTRASEAKNKHKAVLGPPESTPLEKVIAKATRVLKPVSFTPVQKLKVKTSVSVAPFKVNQPEKTRDEGKEMTVSFGSIDETKAKGKAVAMPWSSIFENTEDKRSPILFVNSPETNKRKESVIEVEPNIVAESYSPVQKVNDKPSANVILHEAIPGRTTDKGKATLVSFGSISYGKTKDKGKAVAMRWTSLSEQPEDKGDSTVLVNCPEPKKRKESIIEVGSNAVSESYTPVQKVNDKTRANSIQHEASPEKAKDKGTAAFISFGSRSFYDKAKDKGKAVAMPLNSLSEQTEDKRNPALVLGGCPQTKKGKKSIGLVVSASSCPTLQRKRNTWDDLYAANLVSSRGWTDPRPTRKKKKFTKKHTSPKNFLPEDFVKQQKAYFEEVDNFELEVEEAVDSGEI